MVTSIPDIFKDEVYVPAEPVSLAEAKKQCLVDFPDDDVFITALISGCRAAVEDFCNISITPKQITLTYSIDPDQIPNAPYGVSRWDLAFYGYLPSSSWMQLPYGPVSTVNSITSVVGTSITLGVLNTNYFVRGTQFKSVRLQGMAGTIMIVYNTGWVNGQGAAFCPYDLKQAILQEIAFRYTNRGDARQRYAKANQGICDGARDLAKPFVEECL